MKFSFHKDPSQRTSGRQTEIKRIQKGQIQEQKKTSTRT